MNITRLGMFETNSSSMHSLVLKKVDDVPYGEKIYNDFLDTYWNRDGEIKTILVDFNNFKNENYSRQDGRLLLDTESKLNLYLTLLFQNIYYNEFPAEKDFYVYQMMDLFNKKIDSLNEKFFNKMGINLTVNVKGEDSYWDYLKVYKPSFDIPYVEDDGPLGKLVDLLEDPVNLYSYLYDNESFVLLGGDEYDTAFALEKLISDHLSKKNDIIIVGHLKEVVNEVSK